MFIRFGRNILDVNAQMYINDKVQIRTLAMVEMKCRLTSENLKKVIEDTLRLYNCTLMQICSITTDNGANMIKCCSLLEQDQENFEDTDDDDDANYLNDDLENTPLNSMLRCVRCASHTLQVFYLILNIN